MRRLPILATLVVALAVAAMIALGVWQLRRAQWKEDLLAGLEAAPALPPLDLDRLEALRPSHSFRRARVTCRGAGVRPEARAGRDRAGRSGFAFFLPCGPEGGDAVRSRILVNVGWSNDPRAFAAPRLQGPVAGSLGAVADGEHVVLTSDTAAPPLRPGAAPRIDEIPNNHLFYALQWFFFAAAAALIYGLALRRRRSDALAGAGPSP